MPNNWKDIVDQAGIGWSEIKERLPLAWVVTTIANVNLEQHGSRLVGLCPFHEDNDPSFELWTEDWSRWGCYPCDSMDTHGAGGGDLFDFIAKYEEKNQAESLRRALNLMAEFESSGVKLEFKAPEVPEINFTEITRTAWSEWQPETLNAFFAGQKGLNIPAAWLHEEWNIGSTFEHGVVFPWLRNRFDNKEAPPEVVGFTHRQVGSSVPYARGKKSTLYGEWRDKRRKKVIVCEGETDTLWVSWLMDKHFDVVGVLGAGLNIRDEWVQQLSGRDVWLFFDGDSAGRGAARKWAERLMGAASVIRVVPVGGGRDACDLSESELRSAVNRSPNVINPSGFPVIATPAGYVRNSRTGGQLSHWLFQPERYVKTVGDYAFEGRLVHRGIRTHCIIRGSDFSSGGAIADWCNRYEVRWHGTARDGQGLLDFIDAERPFMTVAKAVERVGFAGPGAFILPEESLGERGSEWVYLPAGAAWRWREVVALEGPGEADLQASLEGLLELHTREVMCSLMGWMAAAPFRGRLKNFPVLAVSGIAGAGKSTLVGEVMRVFGWGGTGANILSASTVYALGSIVSGSGGVPFWLDEYRAGGGADLEGKKRGFEQLMRNAWDMSESPRGGMHRDKAVVDTFKSSAPMVVSGEDIAEARSLGERSWSVRIPRDETLRGAEPGQTPVLGRAWLERCLEVAVPVFDAPNRAALAEALVRWGWEQLRAWGLELVGFDIGEFVKPLVDEQEDLDPSLQALSWALTARDRDLAPLVMERYGRLWVRTWELARAVKELGMDTGAGHKALRRNITEAIGLGAPVRERIGGVGEGWMWPMGSWDVLIGLVGDTEEHGIQNELGSNWAEEG